jgi:hypothetical protein
MTAATQKQARAAARQQAQAAGCTCRPDVISLPAGMVEVRHDDERHLATAGQTAVMVVPSRDGLMATVDLTDAIELAEKFGAIVIGIAEAAIVVPPGVDVPPMVAEFSDIRRVERPGGTVRICSLPDDVVMGGLR